MVAVNHLTAVDTHYARINHERVSAPSNGARLRLVAGDERISTGDGRRRSMASHPTARRLRAVADTAPAPRRLTVVPEPSAPSNPNSVLALVGAASIAFAGACVLFGAITETEAPAREPIEVVAGDTEWGIAAELAGDGDPRAYLPAVADALDGRTLQPGMLLDVG